MCRVVLVGFLLSYATAAAAQTPCTAPPSHPLLTASVSGYTLNLAWTEPAGAESFIIEAGSAFRVADIARLPSRARALSVPLGPASFFVWVRAVNACGESGTSNHWRITVPCLEAAPVLRTVAPGTLRWTLPRNSERQGYVFESGTDPLLADHSGTSMGFQPFACDHLEPTGTWFARVRSQTACGGLLVSNVAAFTIMPWSGVPACQPR